MLEIGGMGGVGAARHRREPNRPPQTVISIRASDIALTNEDDMRGIQGRSHSDLTPAAVTSG
jgi:hypothetical protein